MTRRASEIFDQLCELDLSERELQLAGYCGDDPEFLANVRSLLAAHDQAGQFLNQPTVDSAELAVTAIPLSGIEEPGASIGPYKLLEQIGEGGFGTVYMAQQDAPLRRRVALKVIKAGMDTKQVIARFESERQALAVMDHPNIARVIDAGSTVSGRPYFVMELVRGEPITKFCDQRKLSLRDRLQLFQDVCHAVEHAHQKGIIHRDIKPSNVLVTISNDKPLVKVIDFGIAKATTGPLTDRTLFTEFRQLLGTPLYMSPEQAEQSGVDVDTRTDIYSLGVLLYEVLTGRSPIDPKRLYSAAWAEVQRMILEEEPSKPSVLVSSLHPEILRNTTRSIDSSKLSAMLRGELDWIVLKAMDKDRSRRYPTASQLAADVQKYLNDEPVEATPPSRLYLFRKLARRHRGLLVASAAVVTTLMLGIVATGYAAKTALDMKTQAESRERQAIRAATAAGASVLLPEKEAQRLTDGWLAEIADLRADRKLSQAVLSQTQFTVWRASWLAQHLQLQPALILVADIYEQAKTELGYSDPNFLSLCNLRTQLNEAAGDNPELSAKLFSDLLQSMTETSGENQAFPLLPQYAVSLINAGRTDDALAELQHYVTQQKTRSMPLSQVDMKRLRAAIDSLMCSGKGSAELLADLESLGHTGRVDSVVSSATVDAELVRDHECLQGKWRCEFWKHGTLDERMRVAFTGLDCKTEWLDENNQTIRGRTGAFELSRSGGVKVMTFYHGSSSQIGGTFIYHLTDNELRVVSGMLANQPSLPEIELRVLHRQD